MLNYKPLADAPRTYSGCSNALSSTTYVPVEDKVRIEERSMLRRYLTVHLEQKSAT